MAFYQIEWKRSAVKELEKLSRQLIPRVVAAVKDLSQDPYPHGTKKLSGSSIHKEFASGTIELCMKYLRINLLLKSSALDTERKYIDNDP
jgi:mRNA interferase RelE/StbE